MIDALFGSKTRVKLLNLFFNNPGKSFYVREITRIVDEQVNSVRRELSNMQNVGVVKSMTKERKLYYGVNQRYKYYIPLRAIFANVEIDSSSISEDTSIDLVDLWRGKIKDIRKYIKIFVISGVLVDGSSSTDMLLVGDNTTGKISKWAASIEKQEGRDLNYSILSLEEFYYRLSVRDKFLSGIIEQKNRVIIDSDNLLKNTEEGDDNV
jgi:hypothetical protein